MNSTLVRGGVFGSTEPVDATSPIPGMKLPTLFQGETTAKELAVGATVLVGVALLLRGAMGYYVGKKVLKSNYGWFWGGAFGVPGLAALGLYKGRK